MLEVGVAPREPDDRREAEGARRGARHHAGALGDGLGAQQPRRHLGHRRPAHLRAVDQLPRRARLQMDGRGRGARQQPGARPAIPPRPASTIRPIRSRAASRQSDRRAPNEPRARHQLSTTCASSPSAGCPRSPSTSSRAGWRTSAALPATTSAFAGFDLVPRYGVDVAACNQSTTLFGRTYSGPRRHRADRPRRPVPARRRPDAGGGGQGRQRALHHVGHRHRL